ncbi:cupin domain-containing protein [Streptomyces fuscigenes]|uniref:cupin domain-containing protein n=1 Tax=Streptomyces fuscigenes TaxID=1528880 RepID=UPI001F1BB9F1|nr:cupin domain-containing protein [Streptomyces fuscigenes]MCF3960652.1 cupin domain-containing protein [Streptomyces fuscigenes]
MNSDSDLQIAGDLFEVEHLLLPPKEHPGTVAEFAGLARTLAADRETWGPLVRYDATTRWYHRLRTGPGYEVWLLSWLPGQGSGPHGHGGSAGVLSVLDGELTERTAAGDRTLGRGTQRVYPPGYAHDMVNASLEPAVSLHVYYPGLTDMPMRPVPDAATGRAGTPSAAVPRDTRADTAPGPAGAVARGPVGALAGEASPGAGPSVLPG